MPVGNPIVQATELLKTRPFAGLFEQLRNRFDYIFINTPPILPQATMNVLAGHADVLLLIVRANCNTARRREAGRQFTEEQQSHPRDPERSREPAITFLCLRIRATPDFSPTWGSLSA